MSTAHNRRIAAAMTIPNEKLSMLTSSMFMLGAFLSSFAAVLCVGDNGQAKLETFCKPCCTDSGKTSSAGMISEERQDHDSCKGCTDIQLVQHTISLRQQSALQAELLLAQLERDRSRLELDRSRREAMAAEAQLAALWGGSTDRIQTLSEKEPDLGSLMSLAESIRYQIDSNRQMEHPKRQIEIVAADKSLARAEA